MKRQMESYSSGEKEPINKYYQYKPAVDAEGNPVKHPKVAVLKKDQLISGTYQHTFIDGEYQTHLIKTEEEGQVTIKGCSSLNSFLGSTAKGTYVELTYKGKGAKKPGKNAPFLWKLDREIASATTKTEVVEDASDDESEDSVF